MFAERLVARERRYVPQWLKKRKIYPVQVKKVEIKPTWFERLLLLFRAAENIKLNRAQLHWEGVKNDRQRYWPNPR